MSSRSDDLELRLRWISVFVVILFSAAFALGLILYVWQPGGIAANILVNAGLLLLVASPAVRIGVAAAERIRRGEWSFVAMMGVIAIELVVVLWRASTKG